MYISKINLKEQPLTFIKELKRSPTDYVLVVKSDLDELEHKFKGLEAVIKMITCELDKNKSK